MQIFHFGNEWVLFKFPTRKCIYECNFTSHVSMFWLVYSLMFSFHKTSFRHRSTSLQTQYWYVVIIWSLGWLGPLCNHRITLVFWPGGRWNYGLLPHSYWYTTLPYNYSISAQLIVTRGNYTEEIMKLLQLTVWIEQVENWKADICQLLSTQWQAYKLLI